MQIDLVLDELLPIRFWYLCKVGALPYVNADRIPDMLMQTKNRLALDFTVQIK